MAPSDPPSAALNQGAPNQGLSRHGASTPGVPTPDASTPDAPIPGASPPDARGRRHERNVRHEYTPFDQVVEHSTPWLIDFGGWIFGGLIGLILLIVPALITVGPVGAPIMIATVALARRCP